MWVIFLRAGAVLPFIAILGESGPLFEVRRDVKRFEGLFKRVTPCHVGAAQRPGVQNTSPGDRRPSIKGDKKKSENYKNLKNYKNL